MLGISSSKKTNKTLAPLLVELGLNILVMLFMGWARKKFKPTASPKRKFIDGEIVK